MLLIHSEGCKGQQKDWEKRFLFGGHTCSFLIKSSMRHKKIWQITILSEKFESDTDHSTKQLIKFSQDTASNFLTKNYL